MAAWQKGRRTRWRRRKEEGGSAAKAAERLAVRLAARLTGMTSRERPHDHMDGKQLLIQRETASKASAVLSQPRGGTGGPPTRPPARLPGRKEGRHWVGEEMAGLAWRSSLSPLHEGGKAKKLRQY
jgi:hypothetical protein